MLAVLGPHARKTAMKSLHAPYRLAGATKALKRTSAGQANLLTSEQVSQEAECRARTTR
ncbi:hypothetical protein AB0K18_33750 [Nonomuraea sp. NPDC049421]|uniref:hypothetical protein n=1 Tax=Nonomuraea sp. NPDC049421 TaxID=3155275 RepID=UPI00342597BE